MPEIKVASNGRKYELVDIVKKDGTPGKRARFLKSDEPKASKPKESKPKKATKKTDEKPLVVEQKAPAEQTSRLVKKKPMKAVDISLVPLGSDVDLKPKASVTKRTTRK